MVMFLLFMKKNLEYELRAHGLLAGYGNQFDMVELYNQMLAGPESTTASEKIIGFTVNEVPNFLELNARYAAAEPLYRRALALTEKCPGFITSWLRKDKNKSEAMQETQ